mgnify:CR=1 FL=1|tara:strand:- start:599 stop:1021 length:423 start_codon:yes stop_codon:yes gene_type:complete
MVSRIELSSTEIMGHEPCYYLSEFNRPARDSRSDRRHQQITVIRNDRKVKLTRDIGNSLLFGEEFQLVCGVPNGKGGGEALYSVSEAVQMAQQMNLTPPRKSEFKPKDWNKIFWENVEEKQKWKRGSSTFGPKFKKQRNT